LDKTCPFFRIPDLYIGETTCDGKKKAWEILAQDAPVYVMDLPQMKRRQDVKAWEAEIRLLLKKVEELTGKEVTAESLAESIKLINNKRKALARLYDTRKNNPVPISGKDALLISQIAFYDDPGRFALMTNKLCDELEVCVHEGEGVLPADAPRILVTGTPMAIPNWKLHHILESSGAAVVVEESCTGTRYFENLVDENTADLDGQIKALAERYMKINCACFTPNQKRIEDIIRLAKEYKVDGVVDYTLQFCGLYSTESYNVQKSLKAAGIPVLHIETDYSEQDTEQIRTRVEAFLEMIG
jgi:benzoyl-CoA reductase/2-hydroxyglutaryl-CoA dehydratase subunit BcrC/BadD/HgdB